ncbi:MAG TPA: CoA transferase [Candidatus Thermoplasmatota archaeon]
MRPLRGVRVLEFAPHFPGQYLTRLLGHLGASVTKVEAPDGDSNRHIAPFVTKDVGFLFASSNAQKLLRRLDLRTVSGRRRVAPLIQRADIIVQSFRPGTARKLGIDWAACRQMNPRAIYVALSGWGPRGPLARRHGHDLAYQAAAGMLDPNAPTFPTVGIADLFGTFWAAVTTLAALDETRRTQKGRRIPISVAGSALAASQLARSADLTRPGRPPFMRGLDPFYNLYKCKDGTFIALAAVEPSRKDAALKVLGLTGTKPSRALFERGILRADRDSWIRRFDAADVPCAPVLSPLEAVQFLSGSGALLPPLEMLRTRTRPRGNGSGSVRTRTGTDANRAESSQRPRRRAPGSRQTPEP